MYQSTEPTADDRLWVMVAYCVPVLGSILIYLQDDKKNRPYIKQHNAQALLYGIVGGIVGAVASTLLIFCLGAPLLLTWLVGCYWGYQAYQGQAVRIPLISDFVANQGWNQ